MTHGRAQVRHRPLQVIIRDRLARCVTTGRRRNVRWQGLDSIVIEDASHDVDNLLQRVSSVERRPNGVVQAVELRRGVRQDLCQALAADGDPERPDRVELVQPVCVVPTGDLEMPTLNSFF